MRETEWERESVSMWRLFSEPLSGYDVQSFLGHRMTILFKDPLQELLFNFNSTISYTVETVRPSKAQMQIYNDAEGTMKQKCSATIHKSNQIRTNITWSK